MHALHFPYVNNMDVTVKQPKLINKRKDQLCCVVECKILSKRAGYIPTSPKCSIILLCHIYIRL